MATYDLVLPGKQSPTLDARQEKGLGSVVLLNNARWFIRVRWIVIAIFSITGSAGALTSGQLQDVGLAVPARELWILAAGLVTANVLFLLTLNRMPGGAPSSAVRTHVWLQIIIDLIAVTVLVHSVGSTDTFVAFTYLFHIALSCIFFPKGESLLVTLLAGGLYLLSVSLEIANVWPKSGMFAHAPLLYPRSPFLALVFALSAFFIWIVVWYLTATLSEAVRRRDRQLSLANERLIQADREKTRQMLLTTHDLKAPFAGIESNIEVLKLQYWNEIPQTVRSILEKIDLRAQTLRDRINAILLFGDLKSQEGAAQREEAVGLQEIFTAIEEDLAEQAADRNIALEVRVPTRTVWGKKDQFIILFANLLANAVSYSYEGGKVEVSCRENRDSVTVVIRDQGIGIREEALPHIFDEYYRTNEGAKFNRLSTGLGLAIVKEIARHFSLGIRVSSSPGRGTSFEVTIPASAD